MLFVFGIILLKKVKRQMKIHMPHDIMNEHIYHLQWFVLIADNDFVQGFLFFC